MAIREILIADIIFPASKHAIREEVGDTEGVRLSMLRHGQKYPIVVEESTSNPGKFICIDGRHRIKAAKELGWKTIKATTDKETTPLDRMLLEYTLNYDRKQFTWQELAKAEHKIHEEKQRQYGVRLKGCIGGGGWGLEDTAKAFNRSMSTVSQDMELAKMMADNPELEKCTTRAEALRMLRKLKDGSFIPPERLAKILDNIRQVYLHTDPYEYLMRLEPFGFDTCITNITAEENLPALVKLLQHTMRENCDIWLFNNGVNNFAVQSALREKGFVVESTLFICQFKGETDAYVSYMWASKTLTAPPENIRRVSVHKRDDEFIHRNDIPTSLATNLATARVDIRNLVDPFAYGGGVAQVGLMNKKNVVAIERDPEIHKLGMERLKKAFLPAVDGSGEVEVRVVG